MTTPAPKSTPGNLSSFNILHGFPEALVRGMRSSFLADADYHHLTQCETLDDVRLNLSETDYADALADMNTLIPTGLQKAAVQKVRSFCVCCDLLAGCNGARGGKTKGEDFISTEACLFKAKLNRTRQELLRQHFGVVGIHMTRSVNH